MYEILLSRHQSNTKKNYRLLPLLYNIIKRNVNGYFISNIHRQTDNNFKDTRNMIYFLCAYKI